VGEKEIEWGNKNKRIMLDGEIKVKIMLFKKNQNIIYN